jgi:hypothetical protein
LSPRCPAGVDDLAHAHLGEVIAPGELGIVAAVEQLPDLPVSGREVMGLALGNIDLDSAPVHAEKLHQRNPGLFGQVLAMPKAMSWAVV